MLYSSMEQQITEIITETSAARNAEGVKRWRTPLVSFADADDPLMPELKKWVAPGHLLPGDLQPGARSVVCFYLPFNPEIPKSNRAGRLASEDWVDAYIETNKLITEINKNLKNFIESEGHQCAITPATHNFDPEELISYWSHRHLAYIAGLGTFGINNMLITEKGTAGRFGSCVTDLKLTAGVRPDTEYCLYKAKKTCGACIKRCVNGALTANGFDRFKCYRMCMENDRRYNTGSLADVCGKCVTGVPCTNRKPE